MPGNFRYPNARIVGRHDHVGTPRRFRRDAAMAGAEFAMALDRLWEEQEAPASRWPSPSAASTPMPAVHGLTTVPGALPFQPRRARL
jgi:N-carbamoyl-L-amino-acid hydrolase